MKTHLTLAMAVALVLAISARAQHPGEQERPARPRANQGQDHPLDERRL